MKLRHSLTAGSALMCMAISQPAWAQDEIPSDSIADDEQFDAEDDDRLDSDIVVTADPIRLLEQTPDDSVFGFNKPLLETPRSATLVSDNTIERYGIDEVDDLIAISPGTFTASFYGVKGAVNIRGTLAETYFEGFKRIENRGTYPTPLGSVSRVDIVRGPPTPIYGPGKVGGLLNLVPKTGRSLEGDKLYEPSGSVEFTVGSYSKFNANGELSIPIIVDGVNRGGVFGYIEYEDSKSFYRGIEPTHTLGQFSGEFDITDTLTFAAGGMIYDAKGYVQTPGWNRLSQDLIDNQTYVTGRDTTIVDTDGNGRITPNEAGGGLVQGYFGFPPAVDGRFTLDAGVGTTKLDPRTVYISDADFSDTRTNTFYARLSQELGIGSVILEGFYDDLDNERFVSYGFPADYDSWTYEGRLRYNFKTGIGSAFNVEGTVGLSHKRQDGKRRESYNSGFIVLDRRDISAGASPNDIFDSPFSDEPGNIGLGWDIDIDSSFKDTGIFGLFDMSWGPVNLLLGGRYDFYDVKSIDRGAVCFCTPNTVFEADDEKFSYNASLSLDLDFGLFPYITYAESQAPEIGQAGDISTTLIANDQYLSDSELLEIGVKFQMLNNTLVGSLAAYEQKRTRLAIRDNVVATTAKGIELEARWLATDNLSFTFAGNVQETINEGPDASFTYIPARVTGLPVTGAYGGTFAVFNFATSPVGQPGDYKQRTVPDEVASFYANYVTDEYDWGQLLFTAGVTYAGETAGKIADPVVYPDYALVNASVGYAREGFEVAVNVTNVFDKLYFQPVTDVYQDLAVLPGKGREIQVTFRGSF